MTEENEILGEDIDRAYDEMRDDNTIEMIEKTENLVKELSKLPYYKDNQKRVCKDTDYLKFRLQISKHRFRGKKWRLNVSVEMNCS